MSNFCQVESNYWMKTGCRFLSETAQKDLSPGRGKFGQLSITMLPWVDLVPFLIHYILRVKH